MMFNEHHLFEIASIRGAKDYIMLIWKAPNNVIELLESVVNQHHLPRLEDARFAVAFSDAKPFIRNRFNWGKVMKFNDFNKLWQGHPTYDFSIILCADVWHDILSEQERPALLDLHVTRCTPDYEPEVVIEGNKKMPVKDDWGRVKYTNVRKTDDEGKVKWRINPLDLDTFTQNVVRYGTWMHQLLESDGLNQMFPEIAEGEE